MKTIYQQRMMKRKIMRLYRLQPHWQLRPMTDAELYAILAAVYLAPVA